MRQVLAAVVGGVVAFAWSAFSWTVLPWHETEMKRFREEAAVAQVVRANAPEPGLYRMGDPEERLGDAAGTPPLPFVFGTVTPQGVEMSGTMLLTALLTQLVGALLLVLLLGRTAGLGYLQRVGFLALAAVSGGVLCYLPEWNWWQFPPTYVLVNVADLGITWFLAGLLMARLTPAR